MLSSIWRSFSPLPQAPPHRINPGTSKSLFWPRAQSWLQLATESRPMVPLPASPASKLVRDPVLVSRPPWPHCSAQVARLAAVRCSEQHQLPREMTESDRVLCGARPHPRSSVERFLPSSPSASLASWPSEKVCKGKRVSAQVLSSSYAHWSTHPHPSQGA